MKASEKQALSKKISATLKKHYRGTPGKDNYSSLETILYAICLEDASIEDAKIAFSKLKSSFYDYNEIRVSSITELKELFDGMPHPEKKALQIRATLQYIFEKSFDFDFDFLRRKTLDQAVRQLARFKELSEFVQLHTLQHVMGGHVVPIDTILTNVSIWLGYIEPGLSPQESADAMKSAIRKADTVQFCYLLRRLAVDPRFQKKFSEKYFKPSAKPASLSTANERLIDLLTKPQPSKRKKASTKTKRKQAASKTKQKAASTRKKATKKKTAKKKVVKKKIAKKAAKKKAVKKKSTTRRKTAKKTTGKKNTTKRTKRKK